MSLGKNHDVQRLRDLSSNWIAKKLGVTELDLFSWVERGDERFQPPRLADCSGKQRLLDVPYRKDKAVFKKLNNALQWKQLHHKCAFGGARGCSTFMSARKHLGATCIVTTDVNDCFPSVSAGRFESQLRELHLADGSIEFLSKLLLCRDRIPQGCPTSNIALNLFFWKFDYWLEELCLKQGLAYSRVADDIVISGSDAAIVKNCANAAVTRMLNLGLSRNERKWNERGLQLSEPEMLVHSISVEGTRTRISSQHRAKINQLLDSAVGACRAVQPISFRSCVKYRQQLHGWSNYAGQAGDSIQSRIRMTEQTCDGFVLKRLEKARIHHHLVWWNPVHADRIHSQWQRMTSSFGTAECAELTGVQSIDSDCLPQTGVEFQAIS